MKGNKEKIHLKPCYAKLKQNEVIRLPWENGVQNDKG